jgi:DNA-binding MarR family transcriptional regulator
MLSNTYRIKYDGAMAVQASARPKVSPAHEAQRFFFEIGMAQRMKIGAELTALGLSFAQAHALRLLDPAQPLPMSALAERLFCDASNVTGIADRLESRGLVSRQSLEGDRRVKALTITPAGTKLRAQVMELMSQPPEAIASLSEADQRALRDILERAVENLRARS